MTETNIEWTDFTDNPLKFRRKIDGKIVWACQKVSSGCKNCYAEALARRYGRGGPFDAATMAGVEPSLDQKSLRYLLNSKKISGKRIFIGDMTDIFGEWVSDEILDQLFAVFALRSDVTFQILTKRAARMHEWTNRTWDVPRVLNALGHLPRRYRRDNIHQLIGDRNSTWPLPNVWLGVSVEDQPAADERIPELLRTAAAVRFLSCEPLLDAIDLERPMPGPDLDQGHGVKICQPWMIQSGVDWVIVGGESGPGKRQMNLAWARLIRNQCQYAEVPFLFKQVDKVQPIPDDLMIREFPV